MKLTILEYLSAPERLADYKRWLEDPITRQMRDMARAFIKPSALSSVTGEQALLNHGIHLGLTLHHDFLFDAVDLLEAQAKLAADGSISPDYGYMDMLPAPVKEELLRRKKNT